MADTSGAHRGRRRRPGLVAALVGLATAAAVAVPIAAADSSGTAGTGSAPGPADLPTTAPAARFVPAAPGVRVAVAVKPARPTALRLPSGSHVAVRPASTNAAGQLVVPAHLSAAGWWDGGARLGDPFGTVVIAAHVDSASEGLGPFAQLLDARSGDRVAVTARGVRQVFKVAAVEVVAKTALADRPDLFSAAGRLRLVLITCSGPYDPSSGGYQNLTAVTATAVGGPHRR